MSVPNHECSDDTNSDGSQNCHFRYDSVKDTAVVDGVRCESRVRESREASAVQPELQRNVL